MNTHTDQTVQMHKLTQVHCSRQDKVLGKYFFYSSIKTCCGYPLEAPCQGASNEYPQHIFHGEIQKKKKVNTYFYL